MDSSMLRVYCYIGADTDGDSLSDWEEVNGEVTRYAVDMGEKGYLFFRDYPSDYSGTYTIRTFTYHTNPLNPDTDLDGQNNKYDLVPLDYDMDGDGKINGPVIVNPSNPWYSFHLNIFPRVCNQGIIPNKTDDFLFPHIKEVSTRRLF